MKRLLLSVLFLYVTAANAQITITPGVTKEALVTSFVGTGVTVSNISISGVSNAYGTFSNGNTTNLGITDGALLTTGLASNVAGPNNTGSKGTCNGLSVNDPDLYSMQTPQVDLKDLMVLEFDMVPRCSQLSISFVFGSEEYLEWVNAGYNDVFGFFLSGPGPACQAGYYNSTNVATLPDGITPIDIDRVNTNTNSSYYVNNPLGGSSIQYDGFTKAITRTIDVCPCQTYHLKIAIADAADCNYEDSGVFIDFLQCNNTPLDATITATSACASSNNGTATVVATGSAPITYNWSPEPGSGQGTATATGLTGGVTYTVTIDDALTCVPAITKSIAIPVIPVNVTIVSQTDVSCNGGTNGSAKIAASGGTSPYTYSWSPSGGTGITASGLKAGTYTAKATDANGCTGTQMITIAEPGLISKSQTLTICANESVQVGSNTYTASGTYTDILAAKNGCDSIVYTDLTVKTSIDVTVSITGNTIEAVASGASYQWLDCNTGMSVIDGETNKSFQPSKDAFYAVIVSENSCSDTSACEYVLVTSIDNKMVESVKIFPNPSTGIFTLSGLKSNSALLIYNTQGSLIKEIPQTNTNVILDINKEQSGLYFIKVTHPEYDTFMLKINKQ